ncbi:MAG: glycine--tRNA ligase subunit beta [Turneriella sp.]|nr:glycine--tRNA ligase subunit beta [Turneriella sp.]
MQTADTLLFELATEEIPAAYQKNLHADWEKRLPQLLKATALPYKEIKIFATARRAAFLVSGIAERGEDVTETLQGPAKSVALGADGKPSPALVGFAKKAGIAPEQVEFKDSGKGMYATATVTRTGKSLREALPKLLHELISGFRFPRSMRWGDLPTAYARPIAGYFLQYGKTEWDLQPEALKDTVLEFIAKRPVRGHFILDKNPIVIADAAAYAETLSAAQILVTAKLRRERIAQLLADAAAAEKLQLVENAALLDEVNYLVERPAVVVGSFSADYLRLPDGVILSEMNQHQRYFGLRDAAGKLSNKFLIVANAEISSPAALKNIREGNERVLRARLSDGAFFYDEDLKRPLADRVDDLKQIVFHEGLGTYREKVDRIGEFACLFDAKSFPEATLKQAAHLVKADLTTALVFEFDHLQGEIGTVYARRSGLAEDICAAIQDHYLPRFQGDDLPKTRLGALLSLADKWDNMLAAFVLGKEPTASADPFAIRRQSLYIIQILVAEKISLSLENLISASLKIYAGYRKLSETEIKENTAKVLQFFKARLVTIFESEGFDKKLTRAAIFSGSDDAYDLFTRAAALKDISEKDKAGFEALLSAFKRMANITADTKTAASVDAALFAEAEEIALFTFAGKLHDLVAKPVREYRAIFAEFAAGKPTVDAFFNKVMVNHEKAEIRNNRLALLQHTLAAVRNLIALEELT